MIKFLNVWKVRPFALFVFAVLSIQGCRENNKINESQSIDVDQLAGLPSSIIPRPGPPILYAPPPVAPQLSNTGVWNAQPILISGATAYRSGEFIYQH